ncbi:ATPase [Clostridia bacterium]|nr:ATPase [Clostridia bacterium]
MATYTIIGGVNGVGKSTMLGVLSEQLHDRLGIIVDTDKLIRSAGSRVGGSRIAIAKLNAALYAGRNFTQETTLSSRQVLTTARTAKRLGYTVALNYISIDDIGVIKARVANRVRLGGHGIPDEDVERRFGSRIDNVTAVLAYCDYAEFYDNLAGFRIVGSYSNGVLMSAQTSDTNVPSAFWDMLTAHA